MTTSVLHTIQWKHVEIVNVSCRNSRNIALIMRKAVTEETQLVMMSQCVF